MSSPTWRHDSHPGWYVVGGSPLRRQHFVVDDPPEEVLAELWADPDVVLGSHSMDGGSINRILDADWDYPSLHPSRLITALACPPGDSPALRRLAGLDEVIPRPADDVPRALWAAATARAETALGLAYRSDTPIDLLGAIIEWCRELSGPLPEVATPCSMPARAARSKRYARQPEPGASKPAPHRRALGLVVSGV